MQNRGFLFLFLNFKKLLGQPYPKRVKEHKLSRKVQYPTIFILKNCSPIAKAFCFQLIIKAISNRLFLIPQILLFSIDFSGFFFFF
jgi:hypothetical protein